MKCSPAPPILTDPDAHLHGAYGVGFFKTKAEADRAIRRLHIRTALYVLGALAASSLWWWHLS